MGTQVKEGNRVTLFSFLSIEFRGFLCFSVLRPAILNYLQWLSISVFHFCFVVYIWCASTWSPGKCLKNSNIAYRRESRRWGDFIICF